MSTYKSSGAIPPREPGSRPLKRVATMAGVYGLRNYTVRDIRELKGKRTLVETLAFTPEDAAGARGSLCKSSEDARAALDPKRG